MPEMLRVSTIRKTRHIKVVDNTQGEGCPLVSVLPVETAVCLRCQYYGGSTGINQFECKFYDEEGDISLKNLPMEIKARL